MNITANTRLLGILGDPVSHSLSPVMHNAAYQEMGLDLCYVPLHVSPDALADAVSGIKAMRFMGANVTIPHKVPVVPLLDRLADSAVRTGAVNTLVNSDGMLVGHNTDGAGFIRSLEERISIDYSASPVIIAGAGGAARSVGVALADRGVPRITIINRSRQRAQEFHDLLAAGFPQLEIFMMVPESDYGELMRSSPLVINATPLGMNERLKMVPLKVDAISKYHVVCDLVYGRSQETPLLVAAREKGATILGGLGMLLHQGAVAIRLWTGIEPPIEVMRRAIES
ncbi:MAG: shikimate dehydrogenase [Thermoleophilia bacterium]|nr:shikimate dehydrogenase [Thermoleophilia bacterium]